MPRLVVAERQAIDVRHLGLPLGLGGAEAAAYVAPIVGEGILLGRFQRARSTVDARALEGTGLSLVRRKSGGRALRVGRGQVYVSLELQSPASLGGVSDPSRALNRHVRPILRALTSLSNIAATSGGRDEILARGEVVAHAYVHHHRATGATGLEAIVNVDKSSDLDPRIDLAHGAIERRAARTLSEVLGRDVEPREVVDAILQELTALAGGAEPFEPALTRSRVDPDEAPFTAMIVESIGLIGAVVERDRIAIGGDLMASHDALEELSLALAAADDTGATIDRCLRDAMVLGVKSLDSIRKVVEAAKRANAPG